MASFASGTKAKGPEAMSDKYDDEAEALLPCVIVYGQSCPNPATRHYDSCPAYFRPAVAARLRAQVQLAEARKLLQAVDDLCEVENDDLFQLIRKWLVANREGK